MWYSKRKHLKSFTTGRKETRWQKILVAYQIWWEISWLAHSIFLFSVASKGSGCCCSQAAAFIAIWPAADSHQGPKTSSWKGGLYFSLHFISNSTTTSSLNWFVNLKRRPYYCDSPKGLDVGSDVPAGEQNISCRRSVIPVTFHLQCQSLFCATHSN